MICVGETLGDYALKVSIDHGSKKVPTLHQRRRWSAESSPRRAHRTVPCSRTVMFLDFPCKRSIALLERPQAKAVANQQIEGDVGRAATSE